jgi:hypothetical protein
MSAKGRKESIEKRALAQKVTFETISENWAL